jgi:hypothetical protein
MGLLPSKTQGMTILMTLAALWAIHNVDALEPAKKFLNFDQ